jgi:hypothetical protein
MAELGRSFPELGPSPRFARLQLKYDFDGCHDNWTTTFIEWHVCCVDTPTNPNNTLFRPIARGTRVYLVLLLIRIFVCSEHCHHHPAQLTMENHHIAHTHPHIPVRHYSHCKPRGRCHPIPPEPPVPPTTVPRVSFLHRMHPKEKSMKKQGNTRLNRQQAANWYISFCASSAGNHLNQPCAVITQNQYRAKQR